MKKTIISALFASSIALIGGAASAQATNFSTGASYQAGTNNGATGTGYNSAIVGNVTSATSGGSMATGATNANGYSHVRTVNEGSGSAYAGGSFVPTTGTVNAYTGGQSNTANTSFSTQTGNGTGNTTGSVGVDYSSNAAAQQNQYASGTTSSSTFGGFAKLEAFRNLQTSN